MKVQKKYCILLLIALALFVACKKEPNNVGLGLQSEDELLNATFLDTTTIKAYSVLHNDSAVVSGMVANVLGDVVDPVFGHLQTGVYTQFWLESYGANFGTNPQADSLVLTLTYALSYGDTLNGFKLGVYELTEDIDRTKKYYLGTTFSVNNENLLASPNDYWYPTPSVSSDSSFANAVFRIPLKTSFGDTKFIAKSGGAEYESSSAFLNYFKGLYIVAEDKKGDGSAVTVSLLNSRSRLTLYYHNDDGNYAYTFPINDSTARVSTLNHFDYQGCHADLQAQLNHNYDKADERLFVQSSYGIKTILNFPYLKNTFANKKVIIHKAELVVSRYDDLDTNTYPCPTALTCNYYNKEDATYYSVADAVLGSTYFGGTFDVSTNEYRINLTKHIQYLIDGSGTDADLNLIPTVVGSRLSSLSVYGANPTADKSKRLRLEIYYTEFKD